MGLPYLVADAQHSLFNEWKLHGKTLDAVAGKWWLHRLQAGFCPLQFTTKFGPGTCNRCLSWV